MSYSNYGCNCGSSCGSDCSCGPDYNPINVTNTPTVSPSTSSASNPNNASNSATSVNLSVSGGGGGGCCCCCGKPQEECCCKEGIKRVLQYLNRLFTNPINDTTLSAIRIFGDTVVPEPGCTEGGYLAEVTPGDQVLFTNDTIIINDQVVSLCSISFVTFVFATDSPAEDNLVITNALKEAFDNFIPSSESGCCCQTGIDNYLYYQRVFSMAGCPQFTLEGVTSLFINFGTNPPTVSYGQYTLTQNIIALDTDVVIVGPCITGLENTLTYYAISTCRIASVKLSQICPSVPAE